MHTTQRHYIARGGEVAWTGPCGFTNATLYGFVVQADIALVHEMWSRYIGEPSQDLGAHIDVRALTDRVLFVFIDGERHQETLDGFQGSRGRFDERLGAVVVLGYRDGPNPGPVMFAPYICSSETPGWKADREIYGLPLQHAAVSIDDDDTGMPSSLSIEASVIRHFGKDALAEVVTFLQITKTSGPSGAVRLPALNTQPLRPVGRPAASIVEHPRLGVTFADLGFFEQFSTMPGSPEPDRLAPEISVSEAFEGGLPPMLFLKQFRDVLFAERACYQAIVQSRFALSGRIVELDAPDYILELQEVDSVPICRELGIPAGPVRVESAFRIDIDQLSISETKVVSNPGWNPGLEMPAPDEPSHLPRYVERGGESVWRQPSLLRGAHIHGFAVPVHPDVQRRTLNRYVNDVAAASHSTYGSQPFRLQPCAGLDFVMLLFVEYDRIESGNELDGRLGGSKYREFVATQLAISDDPEYPELDWFIPYISLDIDPPRLGGREIFGYPKQIGIFEPFTVHPTVGTAVELVLKTTAIQHPRHDQARPRLEVLRVEGPSQPTYTVYTSALDMFADMARASGHLASERLFPSIGSGGAGAAPNIFGPGVEIVSALLNSNIGDVFLKEFRDCADPRRACYQAVCKTDTRPAKFHRGALPRPQDFQITVTDLASEPLLRDVLGVPGSGSTMFTPLFAFYVHIDLELTAGRVIANPVAGDYARATDISLRSTRRDAVPPPRRVPRFMEPHWMR